MAFMLAQNPGYMPLVRLLHDWDSFVNDGSFSPPTPGRQHRGGRRGFSAKFDLTETDTTYELYGDVPGIKREDISIEFTDNQTLVVQGRTAQSQRIEIPETVKQLTAEKGDQSAEDAATTHQATVEDDKAETDGNATPQTTNTNDVATTEPSDAQVGTAQQGTKYWFSERAVGQFSRTFTFPSRVDQEGVTANLTDGVLTVVVPKSTKIERRRINVE